MSFIRQSDSNFNKSGRICYYIDGSFVRQSDSIFNKSGRICFYID